MYTLAPVTDNVVAIIGAATALFAATIALNKMILKKCWLIQQLASWIYVSWIGRWRLCAAVFHVMTHAFFKALLFLGAGSCYSCHEWPTGYSVYGWVKKY